jgi:quinol monooxygenase YgiN
MFARITTVALQPGTTTADLLRVHERLVVLLKTMPGFVRYTPMIDRKNAKAVAIEFWQTEVDMHLRSKELSQLRKQVLADLGVIDVSVSEYEVAHRARVHHS